MMIGIVVSLLHNLLSKKVDPFEPDPFGGLNSQPFGPDVSHSMP